MCLVLHHFLLLYAIIKLRNTRKRPCTIEDKLGSANNQRNDCVSRTEFTTSPGNCYGSIFQFVFGPDLTEFRTYFRTHKWIPNSRRNDDIVHLTFSICTANVKIKFHVLCLCRKEKGRKKDEELRSELKCRKNDFCFIRDTFYDLEFVHKNVGRHKIAVKYHLVWSVMPDVP